MTRRDAQTQGASGSMNGHRWYFAGRLASTMAVAVWLTTVPGSLMAQDRAEGNWPEWRGPDGSGVAPAGKPPIAWSETQNVKWKVRIPGEGYSTPIVWQDRIFIQSAVSTGKAGEPASDRETPPEAPAQTATSSRLLDRLDPNKDGKISRQELPEGTLREFFDRLAERYKFDAKKTYTRDELEKILNGADGRNENREGASQGDRQQGGEPQRRRDAGPGQGRPGRNRSAPTEVYQFVVICLDRATGKVVWQEVAREETPHEGRHPTGSFAPASPVTDGKHVFAYFGSRGLYCYDMDGKFKWKQDFGDMRVQNTFGEGSSPALTDTAVIVNWDHEGESFIIALDKLTGSTLWKKPREERTSWSTPLVVDHDGRSQIITAATRRVRSYDAESGELIWECSGLGPNTIPSPVSAAGMVYVMSGFRQNSLLAIRLGGSGDLSASNSIVWRADKGTPYVPSPLLVGEHLYFCSGNTAVLSCLDARSGRVVMEARRLDGLQNVYASPVASAGHVYVVGRNGATAVIRDGAKPEVIATNRLDDPIDASPAIAGNELFLRGHEYLYCISE